MYIQYGNEKKKCMDNEKHLIKIKLMKINSIEINII